MVITSSAGANRIIPLLAVLLLSGSCVILYFPHTGVSLQSAVLEKRPVIFFSLYFLSVSSEIGREREKTL